MESLLEQGAVTDGNIRVMIPVGYIFKTVAPRPDWLKVLSVDDIYSVSGCISEFFADYVGHWKHNGYWLFDSPRVMDEIAKETNLDLAGMTLFYYESFEKEFDEDSKEWLSFEPEPSFTTNVEPPKSAQLEGYDVTTFTAGTTPECSPLSCNHLATEIGVNRHCLFETLEQAKQSLEQGKFEGCEPGPYRIFAVYKLNS